MRVVRQGMTDSRPRQLVNGICFWIDNGLMSDCVFYSRWLWPCLRHAADRCIFKEMRGYYYRVLDLSIIMMMMTIMLNFE